MGAQIPNSVFTVPYTAAHPTRASLVCFLFPKAKFHYAIWFEAGSKLVVELQRAEIWPIIYLASSELARASRSATGLRPASNLSATSFEPASNQIA